MEIKEFLISNYLSEREKNIEVFNECQNFLDFKPESRIKNAGELCIHIINSQLWFMKGLERRDFNGLQHEKASLEKTNDIESFSRLIKKYIEDSMESLASAKLLDFELILPDFFEVKQKNIAWWFNMMLSHDIHHRGQLTVYIRLARGVVPRIYGDSLDFK